MHGSAGSIRERKHNSDSTAELGPQRPRDHKVRAATLHVPIRADRARRQRRDHRDHARNKDYHGG